MSRAQAKCARPECRNLAGYGVGGYWCGRHAGEERARRAEGSLREWRENHARMHGWARATLERERQRAAVAYLERELGVPVVTR